MIQTHRDHFALLLDGGHQLGRSAGDDQVNVLVQLEQIRDALAIGNLIHIFRYLIVAIRSFLTTN